jgi:EAL domain-containing protein (putative c-di-GMP-specific phosphodiesterase class I)
VRDELRKAVKGHRVDLALQPVVELSSGAVARYEALARWWHAAEEWISPGRFIPMAESTGLISVLGEQILQLACEPVKQRGITGGRKRLSIPIAGCRLPLTGAPDTPQLGAGAQRSSA